MYTDTQTGENEKDRSSDGDPRPSPPSATSVGAMVLLNSPSSPGPTTTQLYPPPLHKLTDHDSDELELSEVDGDVIPMGSHIGYHGKSSGKDMILTLMEMKKGDIKEFKRAMNSKFQKRSCIPRQAFELEVRAPRALRLNLLMRGSKRR